MADHPRDSIRDIQKITRKNIEDGAGRMKIHIRLFIGILFFLGFCIGVFAGAELIHRLSGLNYLGSLTSSVIIYGAIIAMNLIHSK